MKTLDLCHLERLILKNRGLYVTQDGGNIWSEAVITIPKKLKKIFVQAELPVKEGENLSVLVNQGPQGDYKGGKVKGKFISKDNGLICFFLRRYSQWK